MDALNEFRAALDDYDRASRRLTSARAAVAASMVNEAKRALTERGIVVGRTIVRINDVAIPYRLQSVDCYFNGGHGNPVVRAKLLHVKSRHVHWSDPTNLRVAPDDQGAYSEVSNDNVC